jgi:8-amino-7-oxononanoate synthase
VLDALDRLGVATPNTDGFPIIEIPLAHADRIGDVGAFLFEHGIYVTLAAYPLVPRSEVGFRIQLTSANTSAEVDALIATLGLLAERLELQPARAEAAA